MSWAFEYLGTPSAVKTAVKANCDKTAELYSGKPEGDDVTTVRDRVVALIDAMAPGVTGVSAKGNGSHASGANGLVAGNASFSVTTIQLVL